MTNPCFNMLRLYGDNAEGGLKELEALAAFRQGRLLAYLCPEPNYDDEQVSALLLKQYERVHIVEVLTGLPLTPEQLRSALQRHWRMEHWGAFNDVGGSAPQSAIVRDEHDVTTLSFVSEGGPPINAYRYAAVRNGLNIEARYTQPGEAPPYGNKWDDDHWWGEYGCDGAWHNEYHKQVVFEPDPPRGLANELCFGFPE